MSYVILRTRHFVVEQKATQRREVIDQVFDCPAFAQDCLEDLEVYHGRGNASSVYYLTPGEVREPTYEIVPIAA
ncbi:hypothetical protein [Agrobacterium pusense]|uniref:hypothetical protein n=1 Tax=Agrobacterium pusense TaxID=648995 RepID=UPI000D38EE03|nr:hypothetical protein [Agrobacterium pusense]PTV70230.1 hypothetical protein DBL06_25540 [Agrobacterium pusense]